MKFKFIFPVILISVFSQMAFSAPTFSYDPTNDLFFAFGSNCKGKGPINDAAIADGASLKAIIEDIRDDVTCRGVFGALNNIENLNVPQLLRQRNAQDDLEYASSQAMDLELAIQTEQASSSPDPDYLLSLKTELINTKVSLAKSRKLPNQERTNRRLEAIKNFQTYSDTLFSQLKISSQCLTNHPNLAAQVGAQVLGLGSSFASGLVGSLMLATGTIIDNVISFIRDNSLSNQVKEIVNNRLAEAVGCSLEGMAYNYCQARDVETVINFNKTKVERNPNAPSWLEGIGIIGQDQQSYLDWVTKLDSGAPAVTIGRASDKKAAFTSRNDLRSTQIDIDGILNSAIRTVAKQKTDEGKSTAIRKALNDIATKLQPKIDVTNLTAPASSPFSQSFTSDPSCGPYVFMYSGGKDRVRFDQGLIQCTTYVINQYKVLPEISSVRATLDLLYAEATQNVNIQLTEVNESNPSLVLAQADAKLQNRRSAREFLSASISYLNNLLADPASIAQRKNQRELIEKTIKQINNALTYLDQVDAPLTRIALLARELIPVEDTFAVPKAMNEIINQDIDQKISLNQVEENLAILMQLSSTDSLGQLVKFYIGLEAARTQARSAKELTGTNLSVVAKTFGDKLQKRMEILSRRSDEGARESLALLCMQTLAVPESPIIGSFDASQYCHRAVYTSVYERSKIRMDYDQLSTRPESEKTCAVYDFYRKSYLYGLRTNSPKIP